jgi:hypothetical protein
MLSNWKGREGKMANQKIQEAVDYYNRIGKQKAIKSLGSVDICVIIKACQT